MATKDNDINTRLRAAIQRASLRLQRESGKPNTKDHEVAIVKQRGERILTPEQTAAYDAKHPSARKQPMNAEASSVYGLPKVRTFDIGGIVEKAGEELGTLKDNFKRNAAQPGAKQQIIDQMPGQQEEKMIPDTPHQSRLNWSIPEIESAPVYDDGGKVTDDRDKMTTGDQPVPRMLSNGQPVEPLHGAETEPAPSQADLENQHIQMRRDQVNQKQDEAITKGSLVDQGMANLAHRQLDAHEARQPQTDVTAPDISTVVPSASAVGPDLIPSTARMNYAGPGAAKMTQGELIPEKQLPTDEYKFKQQDLDRRIEAARDAAVDANSTPGERAQAQTLADQLNLRREELKKPEPTSFLGKVGRVASRIGEAALLPTAPYMLQTFPNPYRDAAQRAGTEGRIKADIGSEKELADTAKLREAEDKSDYELKQDDQGNMWRVSKSGQYPAQMVTFGPGGQPTLTAPPAGATPPAATTAARPTFGSEKGANAPANETQLSEYNSQLPTIAPALTVGERSAFAFPAGYRPTLKEIQDNKAEASKANAAKLSGKREDIANANAIAANNKRTMEEKLIDQVAHDIAPMDVNSLSRLKDITSMRSDQRVLIYARAKELNPNFNTSEVDRKVKMMDNFTTGKDGQQLQSFGTFLEHAGDANQVVQNIRNSATPKVLNVAINQMEREGYGTTATQITAALEPVRKEFEGFLLGGRALYGDDRKAAETILNDASTPAQIQSALKQMAHTVSARYNEMDNRFKNTMGANISSTVGPLSDAAYNSAEAIGITKLGNKELRNGPQGYGWYNANAKEK